MGKKIEWIVYHSRSYVRFRGNLYKVHFVKQEIFRSRMGTWWSKNFIRGYTIGGEIYIKEGTWLGLDRLVLHEIGHILGYDHTWWPLIMHPSWIGRWFMYFIRGEKV